MLKALKNPKAINETSLLSSVTLSSTNFGGKAEIDAYLGLTSTWETIATVHPIEGIVDAEDVASFIASNVNRSQKINNVLIKQAIIVLEACLACEGISLKARRSAEAVLILFRAAAQ